MEFLWSRLPGINVFVVDDLMFAAVLPAATRSRVILD
jgi:hypothetical protein